MIDSDGQWCPSPLLEPLDRLGRPLLGGPFVLHTGRPLSLWEGAQFFRESEPGGGMGDDPAVDSSTEPTNRYVSREDPGKLSENAGVSIWPGRGVVA